MSNKCKLASSINGIFDRMRGSNGTKAARLRTAKKFLRAMHVGRFTDLMNAKDIKGKHLRFYAEYRKDFQLSVRTMQNEMAHLRSVLRKSGNAAIARAPELSNKSLGFSDGSRIGTKTALSDDQFTETRARAMRLRRPGMAAVLGLERYCGLRGLEALSARSDTLARWQREATTEGRIYVMAGTKGRRPRWSELSSLSDAIAAIEIALRVAKNQRSYLITRADGSPAGSLEAARAIYHDWMYRAGIQPHAARYAYAQAEKRAYDEAGFSDREGYLGTTNSLGHGSGRGRWTKSVYMQGVARSTSVRLSGAGVNFLENSEPTSYCHGAYAWTSEGAPSDADNSSWSANGDAYCSSAWGW